MGSLGLIIRVPAITNLVDITISGLLVGGMARGTMGLTPTRLIEATNPGLLETGLSLVEMTTITTRISVEITIVVLVEITTIPTIFLVETTTPISVEITIGGDPGEASNNIASGRNSSLSCLTETNLINHDIAMALDRRLV
jgi:hypothetical protein